MSCPSDSWTFHADLPPVQHRKRTTEKLKLKQIKINQKTVNLLIGEDTASQYQIKAIRKLPSEYLVSTSRLETL